jgi:FkbM family methyltransferase
MVLDKNFIYDIEEKINEKSDIFFYSLIEANKVDVNYICKPYNNSILEKYNNYFNTNHTYESIKAHNKSDKFICLHTFVIPTKIFVKMMTWYCTITDWLHSNYITGVYIESASEVTEEIFGLFLLLQIIEGNNIELQILNLHHEWPNLHNETSFNNYKNPVHYFSLDSIVDSKFTDKKSCHSYLQIYEKLMKEKHLSCKNILEIGIQTGGSMKLWNDYFVNANIYGLDIADSPNFLKEFKRIKTLKINAYSQESIDYFLKKNIFFDFIIDDGAHSIETMIYFIENYTKLLTNDGTLIVEDIPDITWCDIFKKLVPDDCSYEIFDLRHIKNRWDDILFVIKKIKNNKTNLSVCFDIGANIGNWALKNIDKYDKIISVEASKNTFDRLVKNVSNNNKILPLNFAVCDSTDEFIKFYDCESDVLSTINENWLNGGVSRFNVKYKETFSKTVTIDKLIELYGVPDLIKIDVENAEYQCVKSMTKKYNMLCFEWASEFVDIVFKSLDYLYTLGYRSFFIQMNNDEYTFRPSEYYDINKTKEILNNTTPKHEWGMIWSK